MGDLTTALAIGLPTAIATGLGSYYGFRAQHSQQVATVEKKAVEVVKVQTEVTETGRAFVAVIVETQKRLDGVERKAAKLERDLKLCGEENAQLKRVVEAILERDKEPSGAKPAVAGG